MTGRVIESSARNRLLIFTLTSAACAIGWWSMWRLPLDAIADLSDTQVTVYSAHLRAVAEEVGRTGLPACQLVLVGQARRPVLLDRDSQIRLTRASIGGDHDRRRS